MSPSKSANSQTSMTDYITKTAEKKRKLSGEGDDESILARIEPMMAEIAAMKPTIDDTNSVVKSIKIDQASLAKKVTSNTQKIKENSTKLNVMEQRYYETTIEISGVNKTSLEARQNDLTNFVVNLVNKLPNVHINANQIEKPYARVIKTKPEASTIIIVKFLSKSVKAVVMEAKRKSEVKDGVYFNEVMISAYRTLHYEARKFRKEGKIHSVWVRDGIVIVRGVEGGPAKKVFTAADLEAVVEKA